MIHYLKADFYRIYQEKKLFVSLGILFLLSLLSAFLFKDSTSSDNTASLIQLLAQFITLFFIVPANIFWGEDFAHRTINNIIIKQENRHRIFFYKVLSTIIFSLGYVILSYIATAFIRIVLNGQVDFSLFLSSFLHQLPLFVTISLLANFIFVITNKVGQAYLIFILLNLLFDNICRLILSNILHLDIPADYFLFLSLQSGESIPPTTVFLSFPISLAFLFSSAYIFQRKELK